MERLGSPVDANANALVPSWVEENINMWFFLHDCQLILSLPRHCVSQPLYTLCLLLKLIYSLSSIYWPYTYQSWTYAETLCPSSWPTIRSLRLPTSTAPSILPGRRSRPVWLWEILLPPRLLPARWAQEALTMLCYLPRTATRKGTCKQTSMFLSTPIHPRCMYHSRDQQSNYITFRPFSPVWNTTHNQYPPGTPSEEDFIHAGSWINQVPQPANTSHRRSRRHRPQTQLRAYLRQEPHKEPWNAFVAQNRN